jgi:hypothetical protein
MVASSPPSLTTAANLSACDALRTSMSSVWACDMSLSGEAPMEKTTMIEQHLHARQCCILPSRVSAFSKSHVAGRKEPRPAPSSTATPTNTQGIWKA